MVSMVFVNLPVVLGVREPEYVELLARNGVGAELGLDAVALDEVTEAEHAALGRRLRDAGVRVGVHLPFLDLRPGGGDPLVLRAARERLAQGMDRAMEYGAEHMVGHAAYHEHMDGFRRKEWLETSVQTWNTLLEARKGRPLLCLENTYETAPEPLAELLGALPKEEAGACLDVGHWFSFGLGAERHDVGRWLQVLGPRLAHLHLHDNDGSGDLHLGMGAGRIPFGELFGWLQKRGLSLTATLEPHTVDDFRISARYVRDHADWFGGDGK